MLSLFDPRVLLGIVVAFLLSNAATGALLYRRGADDTKAAYTSQQLDQANANIKGLRTQLARSQQQGAEHDQHVQTVHDTTRIIERSVQIPAAADVFLPVGFVRMWDRLASGDARADPYPGKSDGDPSDVKVSEATALLPANFGDACRITRTQLVDLIAVLREAQAKAATETKEKTLLQRMNPF